MRTLIQRDFDAAFAQVDVLATPTAPTTAFKLGEKIDDPLAMYLNDVTTIPANLAGVPGISVPAASPTRTACRSASSSWPRRCRTTAVYRVGAALEAVLVDSWGGPIARPRAGELVAIEQRRRTCETEGAR